MNAYIKLHATVNREQNQPVWFNLDKIVSFYKYGTGSHLEMVNSEVAYVIYETPEEIEEIIKKII